MLVTGVAAVLKYVTKNLEAAKQFIEEGGDTRCQELNGVLKYLQAVETVKTSHDEHQVARLVEEYKLVHEHVPTWLMKSTEVRLYFQICKLIETLITS